MTHLCLYHMTHLCLYHMTHLCLHHMTQLCLFHMTHLSLYHIVCFLVGLQSKIRDYFLKYRRCDLARSCVCHGLILCVTWLIFLLANSFVCVTCFILCLTWRIFPLANSCLSLFDLFIFVTWLMHTCGMTRSYVWHYSFVCLLICMFICVTKRIMPLANSYIYISVYEYMCIYIYK